MNTRTLALGGRFAHRAEYATPMYAMVEPRDGFLELRDEAWHSSHDMPTRTRTDLFGNTVRVFELPAGESEFAWSGVAVVPDELDDADPDAPQLAPDDLPGEALTFLWPSRYVQSDLLSGEAWRLFGDGPRTYQRVWDISEWVRDNIEYRLGSTGPEWTAHDAYTNRYGVCRDLAHTFIALCRGLNIPARYVAGHLPDLDVPVLPTPMDYHAWTQVYLGDRWWTFDPRHAERRKGHVVIARGRDAADVPLLTAFGGPRLTGMTITAEEITD